MSLLARRSLRFRLTVLVCGVAAVVIASLTIGFNLVLRSSLSDDADQVARERAESALETVAVRGDGQLKLIEAPPAQDTGAGVWIYDGAGRALERPTAPPDVQALADSLAGQDQTFAESQSADLRLYARAVTGQQGRQAGTVVSAVSLEPYEHTVKRSLLASMAFAALMFVTIAVATRFLLARALDPVAEMTRSATEWSEHDLDHRFAAGEPHDEITELAAGFDSMLEKLSASLRHEQRLTAEISHELRTPLAAIIAETELALARRRNATQDSDALEHIAERAAALKSILEALLAAARAESFDAPPATALRSILEEALQAGPMTDDVHIVLTPGPDFTVDVEPALLERIVQPILDNARSFARARVLVSARGEGSDVLISVADDGPGVDPGEMSHIFDPGYRGRHRDAAVETGAGLGLALSRRLARAAGGDVQAVKASAGGGAVFEIHLPGRPQQQDSRVTSLRSSGER
jgi:signal transduction histidine kinase